MSSSSVEGYLLSPQQRRLWQLGGDKPAGRRAWFRLRLRGICDSMSLQAALEGTVARHEILRTRFRAIAGMSYPVQEVDGAVSTSFESVDVSDRPVAERAAELRRREQRHAEGPPGDGAGLRATLLRFSPDEHVLTISLPALCADPVSLRNLAYEIAGTGAEGRARAPEDAEPPIQYADLAELFNDLAESDDATAAVAFWRRIDFELLDRQSLPFPSSAEPAVEHMPRRARLDVPEVPVAALEAEAAARGLGLPDALLGLWLILLGRLSRPPRARRWPVLVGRACSGRGFEGLAEAVGLFARHLPIQAEVDDGQPLASFLARVAKSVAEAQERQDYFDWEAAVPAGVRETRAFFPHGFEMRPRWNGAARNGAGLLVDLEEATAYYDLFEVRLEAERRASGLRLDVVYDACRYGEAAAEQLSRALSALLESAASNLDAPVGSLVLLSAEERRRVSAQSVPSTPVSPFVPVHERFDEQARRLPAEVAVENRERSWSYAELAAAAADLARALLAHGVGPEVLVAVCLERTWEVVVALLGIMKAGGAFLPLDPASPPSRQAAILDDAGAELVLCEPSWNELSASDARPLVLSELLGGSWRADGAASLSFRVDAESLAYVLYTSGSSGQPKGVMISHGALANYLEWVGEVLLGSEKPTVPLVTRPSFDASLKQLFGPLLVGGRISILAPEVLDNPVALLETLCEGGGQVLLLNCVPSLWRVLVNAVESDLAPRPGRRLVALLGGEPLPEELLERSFELFDDLEVWNLYGPTEATANVAAARLRPGDPVTLGRSVTNTGLYVLDARLEPLPDALAGEIFLAGAGLARGYRRRPAATARSFVPDPLGGAPGARLYRSGDLARRRAEGPEFLGRLDQQVKLRGYRIELEEIEIVLRRHPEVAEVAVVVQATAAGEPRLVTFVVPREQEMPDGEDLAAFLAGELPEYMVPAYFLMWPELPRTAGGKIDRHQLAAVDPAGYDLCEPYVAPRSPLERQMAEIWSRLLGQEKIGLKDNFYHRGGHSLIAVRILSEIRRTFGVAVPLAAILEAGSLEAMAAAVDEALPVRPMATASRTCRR